MKIIDKSLGTTSSEIDFVGLADKIKKIFPNNECYFIGSSCIDNIEKSDIDFVVLYNKAITVTELRTRREQIALIDKRLQMMSCFKEDQTDLKELPYVSMQDTEDRNIVDRNDFKSEQDYNDYKDKLYTHLWKKRKFNKAIIKDKNRKENRKLSLEDKLKLL